MNNVLSAIPQGASRDEWLQALPRALVAGFVKTDIEFQQKGLFGCLDCVLMLDTKEICFNIVNYLSYLITIYR